MIARETPNSKEAPSDDFLRRVEAVRASYEEAGAHQHTEPGCSDAKAQFPNFPNFPNMT